MWLRESLQGSRPGNRPEPESRHLPRDLTKLPQHREEGGAKGEGGGRGRRPQALRFEVTTVYLVLILTGGRELRGNRGGVGGAAGGDFAANTGGYVRLCFWARSSPAPACVTASLRGLRRSSQQVGRGTRRGPKRRRNQSFRAWRGLGRRGAGGGGGGAEAANDRDPAAAGKLLGSRRRRRGPRPERTQPRPADSAEPSLRDGDGARGAREGALGRRDRAGGRGDSRASQDRSGLGKSPRSPSLKRE